MKIKCPKCGAEHHVDYKIRYCLNDKCKAYLSGTKKEEIVPKEPDIVPETSENVPEIEEIVLEKPKGVLLLGKIVKEEES